jgi:hypothetical protein
MSILGASNYYDAAYVGIARQYVKLQSISNNGHTCKRFTSIVKRIEYCPLVWEMLCHYSRIVFFIHLFLIWDRAVWQIDEKSSSYCGTAIAVWKVRNEHDNQTVE